MIYDIKNFNFLISYDFHNNPLEIIKTDKYFPVKEALDNLNDFLKTNNVFDNILLTNPPLIEYLQYNKEKKGFFAQAQLPKADAIKVNYFRNDLDGLKILTPFYNQSLSYIIYVPSPFLRDNIMEVSYTFWPIDYKDYATYPLRSSNQAWQDLIDGYALVVYMGENNPQDTIIIREIYLAFYDTPDPQEYLQPIFVFDGDNGFRAYLPAVESGWLE